MNHRYTYYSKYDIDCAMRNQYHNNRNKQAK